MCAAMHIVCICNSPFLVYLIFLLRPLVCVNTGTHTPVCIYIYDSFVGALARSLHIVDFNEVKLTGDKGPQTGHANTLYRDSRAVEFLQSCSIKISVRLTAGITIHKLYTPVQLFHNE